MPTPTTKGPKALTSPKCVARFNLLVPEIRRLAALSYGAEDIGPKVGLAPTSVRRYARLAGLDLPNNGRTVFRLDKANWPQIVPPLVKKGVFHRDIAARLGCSSSAVSKWLLNQGISSDRKRR